jgi:hypothetical protein
MCRRGTKEVSHLHSAASVVPNDQSNKPIKAQLLMLLKNWNYVILLLIDMVHLVLIACIGGNISPLLVKNDIKSTVLQTNDRTV